jgi:hypothetical protein
MFVKGLSGLQSLERRIALSTRKWCAAEVNDQRRWAHHPHAPVCPYAKHVALQPLNMDSIRGAQVRRYTCRHSKGPGVQAARDCKRNGEGDTRRRIKGGGGGEERSAARCENDIRHMDKHTHTSQAAAMQHRQVWKAPPTSSLEDVSSNTSSNMNSCVSVYRVRSTFCLCSTTHEDSGHRSGYLQTTQS